MRSFFLSCLFASSALAQVIGPATQLDSPVWWAAQRNQQFPAVTWTGSSFFVVWQDDRDQLSNDLFGAVVTPDGRALSQTSVPLLRRALDQTSPAVAMGSTGAVVAALDVVGVCTEVISFRVDVQALVATAPVRLTPGLCVRDRPAIAWSVASSRFLVVWGRHGAGDEVHGALLDASGQVVTPDFVIAQAANVATTPDVTANGNGFVVAWADDRAQAGRAVIHVSTVSATGMVAAPVTVDVGVATQTDPCIERGAAGLFVSWSEAGTLRAQWFDDTLAPNDSIVTLGTGIRPSCAASRNDVVVAYETTGGGRQVINSMRVTDSGVEDFGTALSNGNWSRIRPRVDVGGDIAFVVTHGATTYIGGEDMAGRAVDLAPDASVYDAGVLLVATSAAPQIRVASAYDGTRYLVAWSDFSRFTSYEAVGQFVEPGTGRWLLGDAGLTLSAGSHNLSSPPMLAGNPDGGFFLSWGDVGSGGALQGRIIGRDGGLGGWQTLSENTSYVNTHASVALPSGFATFSLRSDQLRLRRVGFAGQTLQGDTVVAPTAPGGGTQLSAAVSGDVALVLFLGGDAGINIHGLRFDRDGGLLDVNQRLISSQPGAEADPAVGAGPTMWLAAWTASADGGAGGAREVFAARVDSDGTLLDVVPKRLGRGAQPSVAWWGDSFLVAYTAFDDVVGVRIGTDGALRDFVPLQLATGAEVEQRPTLTQGPPGEVLLSYEAFVASSPYYSFRAHSRVLSVSVTTIDAGVDAGSIDAGVGDSGVVDAGSTVDAGDVDSGVLDSGVLDAGSIDDGGSVDAGEFDAGLTADAGVVVTVDAGPTASPDGGPVVEGPDAGPEVVFHEPRRFGIGLGCSSVPGSFVLLSLAVMALRRRRA